MSYIFYQQAHFAYSLSFSQSAGTSPEQITTWVPGWQFIIFLLPVSLIGHSSYIKANLFFTTFIFEKSMCPWHKYTETIIYEMSQYIFESQQVIEPKVLQVMAAVFGFLKFQRKATRFLRETSNRMKDAGSRQEMVYSVFAHLFSALQQEIFQWSDCRSCREQGQTETLSSLISHVCSLLSCWKSLHFTLPG